MTLSKGCDIFFSDKQEADPFIVSHTHTHCVPLRLLLCLYNCLCAPTFSFIGAQCFFWKKAESLAELLGCTGCYFVTLTGTRLD